MNKEFLNRVLQCNQCSSDDLDFNNVSFENPLQPLGKITCNSCNAEMQFVQGVLIADKKDWTDNQKRNAYVYSDFWDRSDEMLKYHRVTHEDELLKEWRKGFKEGIILDAGCGSGRHLAHWCKYDVKGNALIMVDISNSIFQCRKYYQELNSTKPVIFIQCSLDKIPIKDQLVTNTWSSGVVGLIEDQQDAIRELCRVTKNIFILGVLTEKTIAGKIYIAANIVKPFFNKIRNMNLLFLLSGLIAKFALLLLKALDLINLNLSFIRKEHLRNIINDPNAIERLKYSFYDPIIIPKIIKHADSYYIDGGKQFDFELKAQKTEIICDYFHFIKNE